MINTDKWIQKYNSLEPNNQLIVAESIINELKDNEIFLDKDEYDKEKSKIFRELFNLLSISINQKEELKNNNNIIARFENLSLTNKEIIIDEIISIILKHLNMLEQNEKEKICQKEGHVFNNWIYNKWIENIDTVIDHEYIHNYPVEHENWKRTCSRCGFIQKVKSEPQELIDERENKNKKARIKQLESELKRLKSE